METKKNNIKHATLLIGGNKETRDIYIVDGKVAMIKPEVRQGVFSGVYELDADGDFVLPFFTDSACYALGLKKAGIPKLLQLEYKRFGFFSFISLLNPLDRPAKLFDLKESVKHYADEGMVAKYATGATKSKAYHMGENIYKDLLDDEACVAASTLVADSKGSIEETKFLNVSKQVAAAVFDTETPRVTLAMMGDQANDLMLLNDAIIIGAGDETNIIPCFINRNKALLNAGLNYLNRGGHIMLTAGADLEQMDEGFVSLSQALARIFEAQNNLDGVLVCSLSGGNLPKGKISTSDVRGEIANLSGALKQAVALGVPVEAVISTVTTNPMAAFGIDELAIKVSKQAQFLIVDSALNIKHIVLGQNIYSPDSFKNPVLFF